MDGKFLVDVIAKVILTLAGVVTIYAVGNTVINLIL